MDDSVIKVLRRNGSWKEGTKKTISNDKIRKALELRDEEFSLDENFGILAEEIKKRMRNKSLNSKNNNDKMKPYASKNNKINNSVKKNLLPFLKQVEILVNERDFHATKIKSIDHELEEVKKEIYEIKKNYENNLIEMQNNIDFFDDSIEIIEKIKREI